VPLCARVFSERVEPLCSLLLAVRCLLMELRWNIVGVARWLESGLRSVGATPSPCWEGEGVAEFRQ